MLEQQHRNATAAIMDVFAEAFLPSVNKLWESLINVWGKSSIILDVEDRNERG